MKTTVNREKLSKYLDLVTRITKKVSFLETNILNYILFKVEKDKVILLATDNIVMVKIELDAVSDDPFSFLVDGHILNKVVKMVQDEEISFAMEDNSIKIKPRGKKYEVNINKDSVEEFPEFPIVPDENSMDVDNSILEDMLEKVLYAADKTQIKAEFNSIFITREDNKLVFVATDAKRVSVARKEMDNIFNTEDGIIVPLDSVNLVFQALSFGEKCKILNNGNLFFARTEDVSIVSQTIDKVFPNYKSVVPVDPRYNFVIDSTEFLSMLKRIVFFTAVPNFKAVFEFNIEEKTLTILGQSHIGKAKETVLFDLKKGDENFTVSINVQFLIDVLSRIQTTNVSMFYNTSRNAIKIVPFETSEDSMSLISPIVAL